MGKILGLLMFLAGLAAVYLWGIRPLTQGAQDPGKAITIIARGSPTSVVYTTDERAAAQVAQQFLQGWQDRRYGAMYGLLTSQAQARIGQQRFVHRYEAVMSEATVQRLETALLPLHLDTPEATAPFTVTMHTTAVGLIHQKNTIHMVFAHGRWGIDWYPALIFSQLEDPYVVHLKVVTAKRGAILDRHGQPLAEDGQFVQIGVEPGLINDESLLLTYLSQWLQMKPETIKHLYTLPWAQPDFFMPITTITKPQLDAAPPGLAGVEADGMVTEMTAGRIYPQGSIASILLGYVDPTSRHGKAGLELALDSVLSGQDGTSLEVMNRALTMSAATIARRPALDGKDVRLTIDLATQRAAERGLQIRSGAAVAIDPATGQVLALASTPSYDPNRFEIGATAPRGIGPIRSMFPRATLGAYPMGSIFKIVTMAAAMEKGLYQADTLIDGPGVWYGLGPTHPLHDWLQTGHGTITLTEALTQSCDTCFYQVAQKLDRLDQGVLPHYARAFGLGSVTGIDNVTESAGLVGDDAWKRRTYHDAWRTGDTVNLSIGQGYLLATPLQVASVLAAVGDNGIRRTPSLVLTINGGPILHTGAPQLARLPISPATLKAILQGMVGVTTEATGTAAFQFQGFPWSVAGKTGTAQNPGGNPHAWFAAIAPAAAPRIALAVVVENGGEGSVAAAPIAREMIRAYVPGVLKATPKGPQQLSVPGG